MNQNDIDLINRINDLACKEIEIKGREIHAFELTRSLLDYYPRDAKKWMQYGDCLEEIGRGVEAISSIKKALEFIPENGKCYCYIKLALLVKEHLSFKEAEDWYIRATNSREPVPGYFWASQGAFYADFNNSSKAIECFKRALVYSDGSVDKDEVYNNLGSLCINQGKYQDAIDFFHKSLEIVPDNENTKVFIQSLVDIDKTLTRVSEIETLKKNETSSNFDSVLNNVLKDAVKTFELNHRFVQTKELLLKYLKFRPHHDVAWLTLGNYLSCNSQSREAMKAYQKVLKLNSSQSKHGIYPYMAKVCELYISRREAEKWYLKSIKGTTFTPGWVWERRGKNLAYLGKYEMALECFDEALNADPNTVDRVEVYFGLGKVLRGQGEYNGAITAFKKALILDHSHEEAKIALDGLDGIEETLKLCDEIR